MTRIPFFATLKEAVLFVWHNASDFFAFAYLPVIANTMANVALHESLPQPVPQSPAELMAGISATSVAIWMVAIIAAFGFYVVFAVAWHRHCLLPGEPTTVGAALRWRGRHWRFFAMTIGLACAAIAAAALANVLLGTVLGALAGSAPGQPSGLTLTASILMSFVVLTLFTRFLLIFPAIAIEAPTPTLGATWRLTRGNGVTLFMLLLSVSIGIAIIHQLVQSLWIEALGPFAADGSLLAVALLVLFGQVLTFVGVALTTSVVSIAYRELTAAQAAGGTGAGGGTV